MIGGSDGDAVSLVIVPVTLREANAMIESLHRTHTPPTGHRFALGVADDAGMLRGVAVVGRPVARGSGDPRDVAEVTRVATDGTANACSILLGACARACKAMGFQRIQTYTLPEEGGASLRASGWVLEATTTFGSSKTWQNRPGRLDAPRTEKWRWSLTFQRKELDVRLPETAVEDGQEILF